MDVIDFQLRSWVETVAGSDVSVSHEFSPRESLSTEAREHVTLFLYEILPSTSRQKKVGSPLQVTLRYLVSVDAKSIKESHLLLEKLVFSGMQKHQFYLELMPINPSIFISLGIKSRPCFWLCIDHFQERKPVLTSLITKRVDLRLSSPSSFSGRVMSGNGIPIVGAKINFCGDNISAITDINGNFEMCSIPNQSTNTELTISYKNFIQHVNISLNESPVEILFKPIKESQ